MGKKKHSVDVLFMFILFTVFAVLSVMIIYIGSGVYNRISENKEINEQKRTTLSYMANKVREAGKRENVSVTESDGVSVLTVKSEENGEVIETLIYQYDGRLMEMRVREGDKFDLQFGDTLLKTEGVEFSMDSEKGLLNIRVSDNNKNSSEVSVYLR